MGIRATKADIDALEAAGATVGPAVRLDGVPVGPADGEWSERFPQSPTTSHRKGSKEKSTVIPAIVWQAFGIPEPTPEFRFCERRWLLDFAWADQKVGFEIEGGIWKRGRHSRGAGMQKDMAKYNRLSVLGWKLIRATPQDVKDGSIFKTIREVLHLQ